MKETWLAGSSQHITIRIHGHLPDRYITDFEGMLLSRLGSGETVISGEVRDQAQLFGLLIRIRDLGIPLLAISCCNPQNITEEIDNDENN
jgi:hypothetical protein